MPQTVSVVVSATGQSPSLSSPLYLLRWAPGVGFSPSERLAVVEDADGRTWAAAKRDSESGMYEVPFAADLSRIPHHGGAEAAVVADLALPPVAGLSVTNCEGRAFLAPDPLLADLPRVGTNMAVRLVLYSVEVERPGTVSPGPRESRYASPYPLTSSSLRKSFHRASGEAPDGTVRLTVLPEAEGVGYALVEGAVRRSATLLPPAKVMPEIGGEPCTNDVYDIEGDAPDGYDPTPPEDDDPEGSEEDDCDCGDGGPSLGSFRFRVPLGESASDEHLGFLWAVDDGPAAVTPAKFRVLAAPGVAVVTNADGTLSIDASSLGGRTVAVTNIPHGVAIPVWNASGRFEHEWRVFNEGGDQSRIRVRRVTVLGNATMDETYAAWDEDEPEVFWETRGPAAAWERVDNIRGVAVTRYEWRDAREPEFVSEEYDETSLGGETVRSELRTYEKVGAGSTARRRLSCVSGYDEHGWYEEARTYWHDADHPERNARLRSVQSDRRSWAYFDYDLRGRETLRIEQFDGSPFPELEEVSASAPLPDGCMATVTVTSYDPPDGDDAHRNDSFEPREVSVYIRRGSEPPVMVSHEVRVYTRETDAAGNPLRRIVKTVGHDGAVRAETTVEYPQDSIVPGHLRGLPVFETSPDGTVTTTEYALSGGGLAATVRRYGSSPQSQPSQFPTYTVTVSDAAYRLPLREETRLTATGEVLEWSERAYDDIHRLRSVTYSDGTSETNAYSCCRLLWRRDRQGRKTLRSAQTGTDLLYYAEEEVWLGEVKSVKCKMENDGGLATNGFRVTRHYFDGFGRETNTVTHLGLVPGEASSMSSPYQSHPSYTSQKTTIYSSDTYAGVDWRGLETYGYFGRSAEGEESYENVYGESGGEPFFRTTSTFRRRTGGTAAETRWDDKWRCEATVPDYLADGRRVEYSTTESSDHGVVTNSIATYDLLGRLSTVATPGPNGSWLVASNAYDGATTRMLSTTQHAAGLGPRTTDIIYSDHGEQVGTVLDGVTNRTDVAYAQFSNEWWKVETAIVAGPATNSLRIVMTQLTGRTDACRRHEIELGGASVPLARRTETLVSYDPASDIETETVTSSVAPTVVRRYRHGVLLSSETGGTTTFSSYDAFGRVAETGRSIGNSSPLPVQAFDYTHCGDLLATHTYTNDIDAIAE
ncbi:MAG: hypothetical protein IJG13_12445, partial [Kiritimatiellae bacterium]|nr:hypothetical protein [Kiritimatiellia bacterium]